MELPTNRIRRAATGVMLVLAAISASAQVPETMSFQGELAAPVPANSTQSMTFRIYTATTGGEALWSETKSVTLEARRFSVVLGSTTALTIPFDQQYYIGITIGAGTEMAPRLRLTSAPYSLRARSADIAVGVTDGSITTADLAFTSLPPEGPAGGDLGGSYPEPTVTGLQGRAVADETPLTGASLTWNGSQWAPRSTGDAVPAGYMILGPTPTSPAGYEYSGLRQRATGDFWTSKSTEGFTTREGLAAVTANGRIYVLGGHDGAYLNTNEEYDPATNSWRTRSSSGFTPRSDLAAVEVGGLIYAIGGYNGAALNTNEEYNPVIDTWATRSSGGFTARYQLAAAASGGRLYAIGGRTTSGAISVNEEYDPAENLWLPVSTSGFTGRAGLTAVAIDGLIYAVGGYVVDAVNTNEAYDVSANTWQTKSSAGFTARFLLATSLLDGRIYAFGGASTSGSSSANEAYDPTTDSWATRSSDGFTPGYRLAGASANGRIYLFGGIDGSTYLDRNEEYTGDVTVYLHVKQ
jgi:N-acetylneuraminic acid mutarotase